MNLSLKWENVADLGQVALSDARATTAWGRSLNAV